MKDREEKARIRHALTLVEETRSRDGLKPSEHKEGVVNR